MNDLGKWKQRISFIKECYHAGHWVGPSGVPSVIYSCKNVLELIIKG
ncbi:MAG: hypothetical protein PQ975_03680 [Methanobacterium sp.]